MNFTSAHILDLMNRHMQTWKAVNANRSRKYVKGLAIAIRDAAKFSGGYKHLPSVNILAEVIIAEIAAWQLLTEAAIQDQMTDTADRLANYVEAFGAAMREPLPGLPGGGAYA